MRAKKYTEEATKVNRRLHFRFLSALSFIFLLAGLAGCGSEDAYNSVVAERDAARESTATLTTENTMLKARIPTLLYSSYQDIERGVELSYPAIWVRRDTEQLVPFFVSPKGAVNMGVTKEILPEAMTTDDYFDALNRRLQTEGYALSGLRQTQVGSASGLQAVYLNKRLVQVFVVVVKDQTAWSLIETANADEFIDWAHTFNEVARSFKVR